MIPKQLNEITEADLLRLIGVSESRQLEFKETIGALDEDLKEFLKDISAMANAAGGDVIYGIVQGVDGNGNTVATSVEGLAGVNADDLILRLENLLRDCIKPRLLGSGIQPVPLQNGNTVFVVRVPKSWNPPHVVDRRGHWRFYYRDTAGTHPMDITELRHAMTFGQTLAQRMEEFRLGRLATIAANPVLGGRAKIVFHLQPLTSADPESPIDIGRIRFDRRKLMLVPNTRTEPETRLNFEGLFAYAHNANAGYLQIFRNGSIEAVDTTIPSWRENVGRFPMSTLERNLLNAITRCLGLMNDLGRTSPVRLHLSILGVNGYRLEIENQAQNLDWAFWEQAAENHPIEERDLLLPNLLIMEDQLLRYANLRVPDDNHRNGGYEELFRLTGTLMHPLFDIIWNAGGFNESLYFDQEGVWTGQIRRG